MIDFLIGHLKLSQRIHIGSVLTALIIVVIILIFYGAFNRVSDSLKSFFEFSEQTNTNLAFVADMAEMQRQALLYTYEGFEDSGEQVASLHDRMISQLHGARAITDPRTHDILKRIERNLEQYFQTFQEVQRQRRLQQHLVRTGIRQSANQAQQLIEQMIAASAPTNDARLTLAYTQLLNSLLRIEKDAYRYFDSLDASYIDRAADSIDESRRNIGALKSFQSVDPGQLGHLAKMLDYYEETFIEAVQRTRGFLYLINVVMAADAFEVLYQSRQLSALTVSESGRIKTDLLNQAALTLSRGIFLSVLLLLLAIWFSRLISQTITVPLNRLTATFRQLTAGSSDAEIPAYRKQDEIGSLTLAADHFRAANLELQRKKDELSRSYQALHRINENLEQTVAERTEEIRIQNRDLAVAKQKAEEASQAKSQFLANMSHELRTPMHGIIGMAHLAQEGVQEPKNRDFIAKIGTSARSLLAIINDILDFSKVEAGKLSLEKSVFDLYENVSQVFDLIAVTADEKKLDLIAGYGRGVGRFYEGDALKISQLLTNLLANAVKFTDHGEIVFSVTKIANCRYRFEVADTGIGIAEWEQPKLFQAFVQSDASDVRKYGGTGLGLAIAKQLVELMNGEIRVESRPGEGACFIFEIDLQEAGEEASVNRFDGKRLLLVDNNVSSRRLLREMLLSCGAQVDTLSPGDETLAELQALSEFPDVILLKVGARETYSQHRLAKIQALCSEKAIRLVLICSPLQGKTAHQFTSGREVDGVLQSPVDPVKLNVMLSRLFSKEETIDPHQPSVRTDPRPDFKGLAGHRILLVDDIILNREIIAGLLDGSGIEITEAKNGLEALERFQGHPGKFSLILMDLQMPVMDGFETASRIRALDSNVPILALTANLTPAAVERGKRLGMNRHLAKPIEAKALYQALFECLPTRPNLNVPITDTNPLVLPKGTATIDFAAGIGRMGGNHKLYWKILRNFHQDYRSLDLNRLGSDGLTRTVHTLKGLSANIGAARLHELTTTFERTGDQCLLKQMQETLAEVLDDIHQWLSRQPTASPKKERLEAHRFNESLARLKAALSSMQANQCGFWIEFLQQHEMAAAERQLIEAIKLHAENYQFEKAQALIDQYNGNQAI